MKTITRLMLGVLLLGVFASCENESVNPYTDKTPLWPAYQSGVNKYGYINKEGEFVIPAQFDQASSFSCGYAIVGLNGIYYYINTKGELQQSATYEYKGNFYYGRALVQVGNNTGMINTKLEYAIQPVYYSLGTMSDDGVTYFRRSSSDKNYGLIDKDGKELTQMMFESAPEFDGGVACVTQGTKVGAIDRKGKFVIMPKYDELENMGRGRVIFKESGRYGMLDANGNQILSPMYASIGWFLEDMASCSLTGDKYGYIGLDGKEKLPAIYDAAFPFNCGYAMVAYNNHGMIIDKAGQMLYTMPDGWYSILPICHNGLFLMQKGNEYRYIKPDGTYVYGWTKDGSDKIKVQQRKDQYMLK